MAEQRDTLEEHPIRVFPNSVYNVLLNGVQHEMFVCQLMYQSLSSTF